MCRERKTREREKGEREGGRDGREGDVRKGRREREKERGEGDRGGKGVRDGGIRGHDNTSRLSHNYHFCADFLFSEFLLVTDSREERREWMEQLQKQNPKLLDTHESSASGNTLQVNGSMCVCNNSADCAICTDIFETKTIVWSCTLPVIKL